MLTETTAREAMRLVREYRPDIADVLDTLVPFQAKTLPDGNDGVYDSVDNTITLRSLTDFEPDTLAAVLVHEGTHALDNRNGDLPASKRNLLEATQPEVRAFEATARFWQSIHPRGKAPRTSLDRSLNEDVRMLRDGTLTSWITTMYGLDWLKRVEAARRDALNALKVAA